MSSKKAGELTSAKEVSENLQTPFDATARVMQLMSQKNLLKSEQGASGGYQIIRDLGKTTVHDLVEWIEGTTALVKCIQKEEPCEISQRCNIVSPLATLNNKVNDLYRNITLRELFVEKEYVDVRN